MLVFKKFFEESEVKFIALQLTLALGYIHQQGIIFRDLNPDNIVVDKEGYLKLIDFNLSTVVAEGQQLTTMTGRPGYMSPEMILGYGHHYKTDWWSFGVMIYELIYGDLPFGGKDEKLVYQKIDDNELTFDDLYMEVSDEAKDLISKV